MFWGGVSTSTVLGLQEEWAYGPDFLLFQYTARQYFTQIRQMNEEEEKEEEAEETYKEERMEEGEVGYEEEDEAYFNLHR